MTRRVAVSPLSDIDWSVFGMYLDAKCARQRMSYPRLARICMIPSDDVQRAVDGRRIGQQSFTILCEWLGRDAEFFRIKQLAAKRAAIR